MYLLQVVIITDIQFFSQALCQQFEIAGAVFYRRELWASKSVGARRDVLKFRGCQAPVLTQALFSNAYFYLTGIISIYIKII